MERDSFVFYKDWAMLREKFPKQADKLINAIVDYGIYGKEPTDEAILLCFELIKSQIDRDRAKYETKCEKLRANAKKARKKADATNCKQMLPIATNCKQIEGDNDNVDDNDNVNDNDSPKGERIKLEEEEKRARGKSETLQKRMLELGYQTELSDDDNFWEMTALSLRFSDLGWSVEEAKGKMIEFVADKVFSMEDYSADYDHFRRRFSGWLRSEADYQRRNRKRASNSQEKGLNADYLAARRD